MSTAINKAHSLTTISPSKVLYLRRGDTKGFFLKSFVLLIVYLLGIHSLSNAQNLKEDIKRINDSYFSASSFQQDMYFQLFASSDSEQALESYKAFIQRQGKSYFMRKGEIESLTNEKFTLLIDHDSKAISVQKAVENEMNPTGGVDLDEVLKICSKTEFESKSGNKGIYHFYLENYAYKKMSVEFDRKSFFILKIIMYAADEENPYRAEISFSNIKKEVRFPINTFSEERYLSHNAGKYSPNSSFATYQLLNYIRE